MTVQLSRRGFLASATATLGTLTLGFHIPKAEAQSAAPIAEVNAWVIVQPDEKVILRVARAEMGQGNLTGLAQLLVEELECDWDRTTIEFALPGDSEARGGVFGDFQTGGSGSIRELHETMRQAGATARQMLVAAAAGRWGVPAAECTVTKGVVTHAGSGHSASYGALVADAVHVPPSGNVVLKDPRNWTVAGKPMRRLDQATKVKGEATFGIDVRLPGMLNAALRICPIWGGKLKSFDAKAVASMPGVRHVLQIDETTVAIVADRWWQAKTAIETLPVVWDEGPNTDLSSATIATMLEEGLEATEAYANTNEGDALGVINNGGKVVTAKYSFPYQPHAPLEPMNATALVTADRCDVWAPTQDAGRALEAAAAASGLPTSKCEVHRMFLGGGFGRRLYQDYVTQAVLLAKQIPGTPVKLIWSREEDMTHDCYHPTTRGKLTGALDAEGNLLALHMRIAGQSIRATHQPHRVGAGGADPHMFHGLTDESFGYSIPNRLFEFAMRNPAVRPGSYRGVHLNQNITYLESFIDELAHAAGADAVDFRRKLLVNSPLHLAVLNAVADRIGWTTPAESGRHRGVAVAHGYGSYVAAAAEVSVTEGRLRIHRVVSAIDCGHAVNPELIARQAEGCIAMSLTHTLLSEITIDGGAVKQTNFDGYEIARMPDMPLATETIVMPSGGFWGGCGEPPISVTGPAVLNAVFAATGKRIRDLPLKNHDLSVAG